MGYQSIFTSSGKYRDAKAGTARDYSQDFVPGQYAKVNADIAARKPVVTPKAKPTPPKKLSVFQRAKQVVGDYVVKPAIDTAEKTANTVGAGVVAGEGLKTGVFQAATGRTQKAKQTFAEADKQAGKILDKGLGGKGGYVTSKQAHSTGGGKKAFINDFVRPVSQATSDIAPFVVPGGAATRVGGGLVKRAAVSGVENAAVSGGTAVANTAIQGKLNDKNAKEIPRNLATGFIVGAAAPFAHSAVKNVAAKAAPKLNVKVNNDHVAQGLTDGVVVTKKPQELTLGAEVAGKKVDSAKVAQYVKQIKDGEPIEPVIVHNVGGKTVVVDGQHRLAAMQKLGITDIPTVEKVPGAKPVAATVDTYGGGRPQHELQTEFEAAYNKGDMRAAQAIVNQMPDQSLKQPLQDLIDRRATTSAAPTTSTGQSPTVVTPPRPMPQDIVSAKPGEGSLPQSTTKTSGSALNAEARAVQKGLVKEFKGKAEYSTGSYKQEAQNAVDLVKQNPQEAMDIALGKKPGNNTIHEVAVAKALEDKALKEGDADTLLKLSQSSRHTVTSEAAQRLGAEGYDTEGSVVKQLAALRKARQDAVEKKLRKPVTKAVNNEIQQIRAAKPKVTPKTWDEFVDSIKC